MARSRNAEILLVAGREVAISNTDKLLFPEAKYSKLDLVHYYLAVSQGALRGAGGRPNMLVRYPDGINGEHFYQKRAPTSRPSWIEIVELRFPSGRAAQELVPRDAAALAWLANLGCLELHPHPVRAEDLDHPDELRIDLDPVPGVPWSQVQEVTLVTRAVLEDFGLVGWPKTSGSRGMHIYARLERRWDFDQLRRAALALAREVERRAPKLATSKWWKEERHGVFVDYNQNIRDRTVASAYSVRPTPDARVSTPLSWDEVADVEPAELRLDTVPELVARRGDPAADMDEHVGSLDALLELSRIDEDERGLGDAPWPPHFRKMEGEAPRVAPSRAKSSAKKPPRTKMPLLVVANSPSKEEALAGLERWKTRYPEVAALLAVDDVLVDSMRGTSSTWTRIRVNLRHVPEEMRPAQETPDPDDDPTREWRTRRSSKRG